MAIGEDLTLPDQPAAGSVVFLPLGGNGFLAPHSAFSIDMQITGDASGGGIAFRINRDERFEHLIQSMMLQVDGSAAIQYKFEVFRENDSLFINGGTSSVTTASGGDGAYQLWTPPAMIDPSFWRLKVTNVDGVQVKFKCLIYNFNIEASKKIPLNVLLQNVPRSASSL